MAAPSLTDVRRLADARAPWSATIYGDAEAWLRGNHPSELARAQIRAARDALREAGAPEAVADEICVQLEQLTRPSAAHAPIDSRIATVAIFATAEHTEIIPLTTTPAPWVGVSDRFLIAPLLEGMLALQPVAFVLAASENRIRLIDTNVHPAAAIDVPGLPEDFRSSTNLDLAGDRDALAHLRKTEDPDVRLREYARDIHHAVEPVRRAAQAVVVLAATQPLLSALEATAPAADQIIGHVGGNHDDDTPERVADLADGVVRQYRAGVQQAHVDRLAASPPEMSVHGLEAVERAVTEGRLDTLFIDTEWRTPTAPAGPTHDRGDELIRQALATDATIVPLRSDPSEGSGAVAGILRYPLVR
ncbi:hypothetical protein [Salinibacterium sp. ZJ77]|uniref:baeRF11 domain-containing protein n=1 Tax=Salinibacterium sp. ZJ77 TaxID=2708337 RepID=UPI00141FD411|nr:hypothetical protein [Salinibacterium sp. ZJ77]